MIVRNSVTEFVVSCDDCLHETWVFAYNHTEAYNKAREEHGFSKRYVGVDTEKHVCADCAECKAS